MALGPNSSEKGPITEITEIIVIGPWPEFLGPFAEEFGPEANNRYFGYFCYGRNCASITRHEFLVTINKWNCVATNTKLLNLKW